MKIIIRPLGNSQGVLIPKAILSQVSMGDEAEMTVEKGAIVLRPVRAAPRAGWEAASRRLREAGDDGLTWPEFGNADDAELQW